MRTPECVMVMQELLLACEQAGVMAYEYGRNTQADPVLGRPEMLLCLGGMAPFSPMPYLQPGTALFWAVSIWGIWAF